MHRRFANVAFERIVAILAVVFAFIAISRNALAIDVWTEPNPGVRHLHRTTPAPAEFHALVIDLNAPGVQIHCTALRERWKSTSAFAREGHLAAAMNGGFWGLFGQGAQGLAAGGGQVWSSDDEELGFFAVSRDGRAWISRPSDVVEGSRRGVTDAVSGRPLMVDRGRVSDELTSFARAYLREPRSAVGVSQDGRKVFFVTVDGRRTTSHGGTMIEVADLFIELGAYRAINLDGGGSTTMFVEREGGVVNRPSRGWEREVVNHIGVIASAPPPATAANPPARLVQETPHDVVQRAIEHRSHHMDASDAEEGEGTGLRGWIRARAGRFLVLDRLGLGRHREIVVPILWIAAALTLLGTALFVVRRVVKLRKRAPRVESAG